MIIFFRNFSKLFEQIDTILFLYLIGIFVIAGSLEATGLLQLAGSTILSLSKANILVSTLIILWISAILSSTIDNIPITQVLIPSIQVILKLYPNVTLGAYALTFGANWKDNLTPMGDNILVMNVAEKHKRPIRMKEFWKIGVIATLFQLTMITFYLLIERIPRPLGRG